MAIIFNNFFHIDKVRVLKRQQLKDIFDIGQKKLEIKQSYYEKHCYS